MADIDVTGSLDGNAADPAEEGAAGPAEAGGSVARSADDRPPPRERRLGYAPGFL